MRVWLGPSSAPSVAAATRFAISPWSPPGGGRVAALATGVGSGVARGRLPFCEAVLCFMVVVATVPIPSLRLTSVSTRVAALGSDVKSIAGSARSYADVDVIVDAEE